MKIRSETHDEYGVVNSEGTRALRIRAADLGGITRLATMAVYQGNGLAFTEDGTLNDARDPFIPTDGHGRMLSLDVIPPLANPEERRQAVAAYASSVLSFGQGPLSIDTSTISGDVRIQIH